MFVCLFVIQLYDLPDCGNVLELHAIGCCSVIQYPVYLAKKYLIAVYSQAACKLFGQGLLHALPGSLLKKKRSAYEGCHMAIVSCCVMLLILKKKGKFISFVL